MIEELLRMLLHLRAYVPQPPPHPARRRTPLADGGWEEPNGNVGCTIPQTPIHLSNAPRQYTPQRVAWDDEGRYAILRVGNAMLVDYLFLCDGTSATTTYTHNNNTSLLRTLPSGNARRGGADGEGRVSGRPRRVPWRPRPLGWARRCSKTRNHEMREPKK